MTNACPKSRSSSLFFLTLAAGLILFKRSTGQNFLTNKQLDAVSNNEAGSAKSAMIIFSLIFGNYGDIPERYTCDGDDINPPLKIQGVPKEAKSLVLVVDDPDSPTGTWIHWTVWNIDPKTSVIGENSVPTGAIQGATSFGNIGYGGPCPLEGMHRYFFKLFALDTNVRLGPGATSQELDQMMSGHVLAHAELVGQYKR